MPIDIYFLKVKKKLFYVVFSDEEEQREKDGAVDSKTGINK